ncbi:MAG: ELWxxDGT repeat protein [Ferruginibacter sp.]
MHKYLLGTIFLFNCLINNIKAQTLELVKDINTGSGSSNPYNFTAADNKLFFVAKADDNQFRLYVSEGTAATTQLLGPATGLNGTIYSMIAYNNKLFFTCNDGVNGQELWTSDGTAAGTVLFKDLYPGATGSFPSAFTVTNGKLFFMGNGVDGERRLYVSDGTPSGTIIIRNNYINIFNGFSDFAVMNNEIYFISDGAPLYPSGLWKSDGTLAGTVLVYAGGGFSPGVFGSNYAVLNNKMYFSGYDDTNGGELWVTDGTYGGTHMVINLRTDGVGILNSSMPMALTVYNSSIYFSAADDTHGQELFMTDGTAAGTMLVKDMWVGPSGSVPYEITIYNGLLYILNNYNLEMWKSNGTTAGTQLVATAPQTARFGAVWNNKLFIISGTNQWLWQSDGVAGTIDYATATNTTSLIAISQTDLHLIQYNGGLYFGGNSAVISPTTEPLKLVAASVVTNFIFTGNGNWSNPANWAGGIVPPAILPAGNSVVISGNCVLDIAVTAQAGSSVTVVSGGSLLIPGSLTIL